MWVLVSRDKAGKASLAGFAESSGSIGTPDLVVDNDKRRLVHVGGTLAGSGGGNADALFVSDTATAKWRRVDLSAWSEPGGKLLPPSSDEHRVGQEGVSKCRSRWSP